MATVRWIIQQWLIDELPTLRWAPAMIALLLAAAATDPLLLQVQEAGAPPPLTCPVDILMEFSGDEGTESQRLRYDPETEEVVVLDEDGNPVPEEVNPEADDEEDADENSISMGDTGYAEVLELLELPLERIAETEGEVVFRAEGLPKGTIDLGELDLSKRSALELTVTQGEGGPYVSQYRTELLKPTRVKVVARIRSFDQTIRFAEVDGDPRKQSQSLSANMSVFGADQSFGMMMSMEYPPCESTSD